MDIPSLIAGTSASLAVLKDLGGAWLNERDSQKAAAIKLDFSEKLLDAHAKFGELLGSVIEQQGRAQTLEQQVRDMEAAKAEKERYALTDMGSGGQFFAYRLRDAAELRERADEVPHFVCQPCFEAGKKHVLIHNGSGYWDCPCCKHGRQVGEAPPIARRRRSSTWSRF